MTAAGKLVGAMMGFLAVDLAAVLFVLGLMLAFVHGFSAVLISSTFFQFFLFTGHIVILFDFTA
jgi:hypothetical protein